MPSSPSPRRARAIARLLAATVLLPLLVALLGIWEQQRAGGDLADVEAERLRLAQAVDDLQARMPRDGQPDYSLQFRRGGKLYGGPLALTEARDALSDAKTATSVMQARGYLPPIVIVSAGLTAVLSGVALLAGAALGGAGRASRDMLVRGFSLVRRVLPTILAAQVLLGTVAIVAATLFEASVLLQPGHFSVDEAKVLGIAAVVAGGSLWIAISTVLQLRHTLAAFEPDPLEVIGRTVSREDAPGLWRLVDVLAERLGALRPDNVVVGLTGGFFVSSGPKTLQPSGAALAGRTLYLPVPYLPLLRTDEVATIIGHELAHFSGRDTDYSLRFLPIYVGVARSLQAVEAGGWGERGGASPTLLPALWIGRFVMEQFHHAVRHWSRRREFEADAAGASLTSAEASARALLRTSAIAPRIAETLDAAAEAPGAASPDLPAAVLETVFARGLDDPARHLEDEQPHPTDTHPPTTQRVVALGHAVDAALLAAAAEPPPANALERLAFYFAHPAELSRAATADFLELVQQNEAAFRARLEEAAAQVESDEQVLRQNLRPGAILVVGMSVVFMLIGLALAVLGLPGIDTFTIRITAAIAFVGGAALLLRGVLVLRRVERPFLTLTPDAFAVPGLDRPIRWDDIADLDMTCSNSVMTTRVLLAPEAPLPALVKRNATVKLDAKNGIITLRGLLPRKMKPDGFAEVIGRYRQAAAARRLLRQGRADAGPHPTFAPGSQL